MSDEYEITEADVLVEEFMRVWNRLLNKECPSNEEKYAANLLHNISISIQTHRLTKSMNARTGKPCNCRGCVVIQAEVDALKK